MDIGDDVSGSRSGCSLPVPNVQELAGRSSGGLNTEIPHRYVRPEVEAEPLAGDENVPFPVIDMGLLLDPEFCKEESLKLKIACAEWGFFQIINHGISEEVINKMKDDIIEFFKLPLKEKEAYAQLPNDLEGYGQAFVTSEEQKLDWADMMYIITHPSSSRNLRFWPTHPPTFRDTLEKYSLALRDVAGSLLESMAIDMGIDPKSFSSKLRKSQAVRINYYPPFPQPDKVLGLSPHSDAVGLTILLQISDNVHGLQIKKDGKWLPVPVHPNALIVNIGDMLEIMSNGRLRSIEHRAMINAEKERLSIATFHSPSNGVTVGPLPELIVNGSEEEKYASISYEDYMKTFLSAKLDGRSLLERMKL